MTRVRTRDTDEILLCCWDDCGQYGHAEFYHTVVESNTKRVTYIFCNARHRLYWMNSHLDNGNLPAGMKHIQ